MNIKKISVISIIFVFIFFMNIHTTFAITPISEEKYQGIDVSNWQGYINYEQVKKAGI